MIKKVGSKYCLFSKDGKKKLACHPTRPEAAAQERAIQVRKRSAFDFVTVAEMADLCQPCANDMRKRGLAAVSVQALAFAMPPALRKGLVKKIGPARKGFRTRCMKIIAGKVRNSGAFCNALKQDTFGSVSSSEFFDPENDAAGPSREFLKQMFGLLRGRLTKQDFDTAVRKARAKAGGIMSGRKRKRTKARQAYAS